MNAGPHASLPIGLLEGFADCLWVMDLDGLVLSGGLVGRGAGVDGDDWTGRGWVELADPADRAHADRLWGEARATARPVDALLRLRLAQGAASELIHLRLVPDAGAQWWHGIGRRIPNGDGDAHRRLIETIDDGFCTVEILRDGDGQAVDHRFVSVNSAFERQSGLSNAAGRTARELVPDLPRKWLDRYDRIARSGVPERFEEEQESPHRFYEIYAAPFGEAGGRRLAVLFRDVLPRKRAEQKLAASERRLTTLIRSMPQSVWRADDTGRWIWASPQWTTYTGQTESEGLGLGWLRAIHPDDRAQVVTAWAEARLRGEFQAELRIRHAGEGGERWFHALAMPVRDDSGTAREWVGTCTDVDDMRRLQARQEVLLAELQHRTRNLLGVVASVADRTARSARSLPEFLPRFRERLGALSRINGLLSQLDRGQRVTFDELIRTELGARGVLEPGGSERVVLEGPGGVRLRSASVQTFALAIHELATNAMKYGAFSGAGGRLEVRWHLRACEDGRRRLRVEWTESGGAPRAAAVSPNGGYGRELIEKALPYQLKALTRYEIGPDGVRCTIDLPVD